MSTRDEDNPHRIERPDIEIGASVKAKRLRFSKKPETDVRVETRPDGEGGSSSERENLPETVEPGVTYRDVQVRWLAAGRLADVDAQDERGDDDGQE
jgi:hypothetical protein